MQGFLPLIAPVLEIVPVPFVLPDDCQRLVFTSANAVRMAAASLQSRQQMLYCVGSHTAQIARACGWKTIKKAEGNMAALNRLLASEKPESGASFVHLSGADIAAPVKIAGKHVRRIVVYKAISSEKLDEDVWHILETGKMYAALFFSSRSAAAFVTLAERRGCTHTVMATKALCLADSMVKSISGLPWRSVQVAETPDRKSLLALL